MNTSCSCRVRFSASLRRRFCTSSVATPEGSVTSTSTPHPAIRIGPSMLAPASPISLMAVLSGEIPRSRRALTTMDGVIGSPSPDRAFAGSAQAGAACCLRPTDHRASNARNGPIVSSGPQTTCTMRISRAMKSTVADSGVTTSLTWPVLMAITTPSATSTPTLMPAPTATPLAASTGEWSRSMRRWWRAARKRCNRSSHSSAASRFPAASAARITRSYREPVRPSHARRATIRLPLRV